MNFRAPIVSKPYLNSLENPLVPLMTTDLVESPTDFHMQGKFNDPKLCCFAHRKWLIRG